MSEEFYCLDLQERAELVRRHGQLLVDTNFYGASVRLYNLKSKFIEVYHHPVTRRVMRVSIAVDADLNKHLKEIKLA
jgi:hypothetical protein